MNVLYNEITWGVRNDEISKGLYDQSKRDKSLLARVCNQNAGG